MDRIRRLWASRAVYEPIEDLANADEVQDGLPERDEPSKVVPSFSRYEYSVFLILGISMLWAWNMFLAAAPYFYRRFQSHEWAATHYQSSILSVSTVTNLGSAWLLAKLQRNASYARRVIISLIINSFIFTLLAISTVLMRDVGVVAYFGFLMVMVFGASFATGMNQNGVFAYVSGFGREEYTQAIMAGQGIAGVLPSIVQILSVAAVADAGKTRGPATSSLDSDLYPSPRGSSEKSAFAYFITATAVSTFALLCFLHLDQQQQRRRSSSFSSMRGGTAAAPDEGSFAAASSATAAVSGPIENGKPSVVGLLALFKKLRWMALAVFICFAVTMTFPVFTAEIESVNYDSPDSLRIFSPAIFIPLALLCWNLGDLIGRMAVLVLWLSKLSRYPRLLFLFAIARMVFIPLYLLCNIRGRGAVVRSDFFYLFVVQLLFGITNGYLGSSCMMGAGQFVSVEEREPAGGFMSLMLVGGLATGSLLSFLVAGT